MFGGFNANRLKVQLKLAINRLKMLQSKKSNQNAGARKQIAQLLEKGKDESARIKVEHIIREDYMIEAMELLELYCDLLLARFGLIEGMKYPDEGIKEALYTVIWVAPRLAADIAEFSSIRDLIISKYGKEFGMDAMENKSNQVSPRITAKFNMHQPDPYLVTQYLIEIAKSHNVDWTPPIEEPTMDAPPPAVDMSAFHPGNFGPGGPGGPGNGGGSNGGGGGGMAVSGKHIEAGFAPMQMPVSHVPPSAAFGRPPPPQQSQQPPQGYAMPPQSNPYLPPQYGQPQEATYESPQVFKQSMPPGGPGVGAPPPLPPRNESTYSDAGAPPGIGGYAAPPVSYTGDVLNLPSVPAGPPTSAGGDDDDDPDFDDLTRRFEALKKR
eukprot:Opistho-2@23581